LEGVKLDDGCSRLTTGSAVYCFGLAAVSQERQMVNAILYFVHPQKAYCLLYLDGNHEIKSTMSSNQARKIRIIDEDFCRFEFDVEDV
jgi:hypothetical protein